MQFYLLLSLRTLFERCQFFKRFVSCTCILGVLSFLKGERSRFTRYHTVCLPHYELLNQWTLKCFVYTFLISVLNKSMFKRNLKYSPYKQSWSGDSSMAIATGLSPGFDSLQGQEIFYLLVQTGSGVHPASYPMVPGALSPG
jgi:hypothetical protein